MQTLRNIAAAVAALAFVAGLNLLIVQETLFTSLVLGSWGIAALAGGIALIAWLAALTRKQGRSAIGLVNTIVAGAFVFGIGVVLFALTAREGWSWDLTQEGRRELAPQTKLVLQSLTEPVEVVCFFVRTGDERIRIAQEKTVRFLEECREYGPQIEIVRVDPQQSPEQVQEYGALGVQKSQVGSVLIKSGARQREIPLSDVNARLEERDFTNALINVTRNAIPKVYFLQGHGGWDLRSDAPKNGSIEFARLLARESYEIAQLTIQPDAPTVPSDCSVLVVNGFTDDLREYEKEALDRYMRDGGRMLLLINPLYRQEAAVPVVERLRPWLTERFGIELPFDVLVSAETGGYQLIYVPDFSIFPDFLDPAPPNAFRGSYNAQHPVTRGMDKQIVMNFVRSVKSVSELPEGVTHTTLLRSSPGTWAETDLKAVLDRQPIGQDPFEAAGPLPVAVAVTAQAEVDVSDETRPRESRAILVGNAFISTNEFMMYAGVQDFLLNSLAWLTENEELIAIRPTGDVEQPLILTKGQQRVIAWVASLGTVQAIALVGIVVLLYRRRYQ